MKYMHIRSFLLVLLMVGQGQVGNAAPLAAPSGVLPMKNPMLKTMPLKKVAFNKTASTSLRKPPARLVGKTLKSSATPQIGFTLLPAGSSVKALSKDGQWIFGNCDGYPAIFDRAGNVAKMTNGNNSFVPGSKNTITGMYTDGKLCGTLQTASGVTAPTKAFYAKATVSSGSIQLPDPTLIPIASYPGNSTAEGIGFYNPRICGTATTATGSTVGYTYDIGSTGIIPLVTTSGSSSTATCITANGSMIFGTEANTGKWWLLDASGTKTGSLDFQVNAASPNGGTVVGKTIVTDPNVNSIATVGMMWTSLNNASPLYSYNYAYNFPIPTDATTLSVSAESNLLGGTQTVSGSTKGFIYSGGDGGLSECYSMQDWLMYRGITLSYASDMLAGNVTSVNGISADGTLFVGNTADSSGTPCGYIAYVGNSGPAGKDGTNGTDGINGAPGPIGLTGATGAKGDKGDTGAVGAKGDTGPKGDTGAAGPAGLAGSTGRDGREGRDGMTGAAGAPGAAGPTGATGAQGPQGPAAPKRVQPIQDIASRRSRVFPQE